MLQQFIQVRQTKTKKKQKVVGWTKYSRKKAITEKNDGYIFLEKQQQNEVGWTKTKEQ